MSLFLLFEALFKFFNKLLKATETFNFGFFFFSKIFFKFLAQPVLGNQCFNNIVEIFEILKIGTKGAIKAVVVFLVFDHNRARQQIEVIYRGKGEVLLQSCE